MVTIKTASEMANLTIKSIRFYEKNGIINPISRTDSGYRLYSEDDIRMLQQIKLYKDLKFTLKDMPLLLKADSPQKHLLITKQVKRIYKIRQEYKRISRLLETSLLMDTTKTNHLKVDNPYSKVAIIANEFLEGGVLPCSRIEDLIEPLNSLFKMARLENIPIIYVPDIHTKSDNDTAELEIWGDHCIEGTWGSEIIDKLTPLEHDYIIPKSYFNGFIQTELQNLLDELDVEVLIFTGWRTHVCITQTAIEAFHRGYRVFIASDGVNSNTQEEHDFALNMLKSNYGFQVCPCDTIITKIKEGN